VSPVKYELGLYISEDDILHSHSNTFTFLYVYDVLTSQEAYASTACYGDSFNFICR
jgi:hypothetical protein